MNAEKTAFKNWPTTNLENLLLRLHGNKKSSDSIAIATEQIKEMVETHKERQRKVN